MPVRAGRVPHMGGVQLEAPTEAWKRDIEDTGVLRAEIQAKVRDAERLSAEKSSEEAEHARRERLLAAQARSSLRDSLADTFMASMAAGAANHFLTNLKARHVAQRKQGEDAQPDDEQEQPTVEQEQPTEEQVGGAAAGQPSVAMAGRVTMADVGRARRRERQRRRVERERSDPQHTREWAKLRAAAHMKATTHTTRVTTAPAVRGRSRRSRYAQAQGGRRRRRRARRSAGPAGAPPDDVSQQHQEAAETTTGVPTRRWALEQVPLVLTIACSDLLGYRPPSAKAPKIGANGQPIVQLEAEDVHAVLEVQRSGDWEEWGRTEECQHAGCPQVTSASLPRCSVSSRPALPTLCARRPLRPFCPCICQACVRIRAAALPGASLSDMTCRPAAVRQVLRLHILPAVRPGWRTPRAISWAGIRKHGTG
jgi:hypothetical protein